MNAQRKLLFLVNPHAGKAAIGGKLLPVLEVFTQAGYRPTVCLSRQSGELTEVARREAGDYDLVVCSGGDGTLNETVNGLMGLEHPPALGYIPAGTTNDFARGLKIPANVMAAARAVVEGTPQPLDMGRFGQRYFCYVASFGVFTRLSYATPQNVKNALGHMAYLMGGIQELSQLRPTHMRFTLDGGRVVEDDFVFGAVCNATSLGGVLMLDPNRVDLQDGKFELLLIRSPKDLVELADCVRALQSQKYDSGHITFLSASRMEVKTEEEMCWTLDGEQGDSGCQAVVENLHHAVRVILKG